MYGLNPEVDLSFLAGAELIQIAIDQYQIILNLAPSVSIMIASSVRVGEDDHVISDAPNAGRALLPQLGCTIAAASGTPDGTLRISWSSGQELEIFDDSSHYESYTITTAERTIVV